MSSKQTVYRRGQNPNVVQVSDLQIVDREHKPSWLRYGTGTAILEVQANNDPDRGGVWLSICTEESGGGYDVWDNKARKVVFHSDSKPETIGKSQELNGWPVDGDETSYAKQRDAR